MPPSRGMRSTSPRSSSGGRHDRGYRGVGLASPRTYLWHWTHFIVTSIQASVKAATNMITARPPLIEPQVFVVAFLNDCIFAPLVGQHAIGEAAKGLPGLLPGRGGLPR
jgi:hypothetical protein